MRKLMRSRSFVISGSEEFTSSYIMTRSHHWIDWKKAAALPVCTNFVNRGVFSPGDSVQHVNPFLLYVEIPLEGDLCLIQRDREYTISPGRVGLLHQHEDNFLETGKSGFCRKLSLGFTGTALSTIVCQTGLAGQVVFPVRNFQTLYTLFDRIEKLLFRKDGNTHPELCALSLQFLLELATQIQPAYPEKLSEAITLMHSRIGTNMTLEELAGELHVGKSTLDRLFRLHLNCSPKDYCRNLRMEKAKTLLLQSTLSVKEIASLCGYRDPFNFTNAFRHCAGVSPRDYRKQNRKHPDSAESVQLV